ncbi:MAG: endonuclease domain-containing protein, partial [Pseudomonadota bacterium]
ARQLRRHQTDVEAKFWQRLRNRGAGLKFRRQVPIKNYIVDFFAHEVKLAIELDGAQHAEQQVVYDQKRTLKLEETGITVLHFWNHEVNDNIEDVVERICWMAEDLKGRLSHAPSPEAALAASTSPKGRGL